jgi:hypothetical protein
MLQIIMKLLQNFPPNLPIRAFFGLSKMHGLNKKDRAEQLKD